ncbi:hypothetical protein C2S53_013700 [Perilla frutescens var. hirtella]|uniref:TPD1 protein homolog 1-like n=1 Tax=Perilla frutescens var. hirtella TaxID=608512 RepID=A0AAD4J855_PERFH|nr:hypothetical protein C2S53_013700 [Perilla frutescens var. hirtella]
MMMSSKMYWFLSVVLVGLVLMNLPPLISSSSGSGSRKLITQTDSCSHPEIEVSQSPESSSKGIPRYRVLIANLCSDCWIEQLHVHCGEFASANIVDPQLFKRVADGDCLVNAGRRLDSGKVIQFYYSNTFPYPLSIGNYVCGH